MPEKMRIAGLSLDPRIGAASSLDSHPMNTAASPVLLAYPLVVRGLMPDSTVVVDASHAGKSVG